MVTTLDDFPTEILEEIVSHLDDFRTDLWAVAQLSRRLNSLAFARYFSFPGTQKENWPFKTWGNDGGGRHDVLGYEPKSKDHHRTAEDDLKDLAIAFDVQKLNSFIWSIPAKLKTPDIPLHLERLARILGRLTAVQEICISLSDYTNPRQSEPLIEELPHNQSREEWYTIHSMLFSTLVKLGCTRLTIENGTHPQTMRSTGQALVDFAKDARGYLRHPSHPSKCSSTNDVALPDTIRDCSRIQELTVCSSPMLLLEPCFEWVRPVLSSAHLTSLFLKDIYHADWEMVLPEMLDTLQYKLDELSIINCRDIPIEPFAQLIFGIHSLTRLTIRGAGIPSVHHRPPFPPLSVIPADGLSGKLRGSGGAHPPPFAKLKYLNAESDWVSWLCSTSARAGAENPDQGSTRSSSMSMSVLERIEIRPRREVNVDPPEGWYYHLQYARILPPHLLARCHSRSWHSQVEPIPEHTAKNERDLTVSLDFSHLDWLDALCQLFSTVEFRDQIRGNDFGSAPAPLNQFLKYPTAATSVTTTTTTTTSSSTSSASPSLRNLKASLNELAHELVISESTITKSDADYRDEFCQFFGLWQGVRRIRVVRNREHEGAKYVPLGGRKGGERWVAALEREWGGMVKAHCPGVERLLVCGAVVDFTKMV